MLSQAKKLGETSHVLTSDGDLYFRSVKRVSQRLATSAKMFGQEGLGHRVKSEAILGSLETMTSPA
jgi:hypothetical protein